ncbi:MAG: prepilin-type N-terminal cleavage/methylation domain-containing protein [Bdellovibrionaceae bacterium]|nr:prepilin-type N-terminal cleavage/methylation domain-containing protein [Pseudobdellovibrionaceae bacterium]
MRNLRSQKGFTIVEVMIAMLILGMVLLAWMSLESFTAQTVRRVSDFSAGQKVMLTIMNDVLSSEKGLPAFEPRPEFFKTNLTRAELKDAFDKTTGRKSLCYDRNAMLTTDPIACYYRVSYFKIRVRDNTYVGSELSNIPMARVIVQISYQDKNDAENNDADPDNNVTKTRFLTRLVSNVADY